MAQFDPTTDPRVQRAESQKYGPDCWHILEVSTDVWALFGYQRDLVALGSMDDVIRAYRARAPWVPDTPLSDLTLDLSGLDL